MFFTQQTDPAAGRELSLGHLQAQMKPLCPEINKELPHLSFMHPLPYVLPSGAADSTLAAPRSQSMAPDGNPSSSTLMTPMPLVPPVVPGPRIIGDPEKRDMVPTFGVPPIGHHSPGGPAGQPLVTRFKTIRSQCDGASVSGSTPPVPQASNQGPIRPMSVISPGATAFPSSLQKCLPCPDPASVSSVPHVEPSHAKHPSLTLPPALPSPYTLHPAPTSAATGVVQPALPPAVPTHTPGPAPSPSPALTHSTAHSDSTSYSNSSTSCGIAHVPGSPLPLQQSQQTQVSPQQPAPAPQQQPMGCGTCGCHNNCGGRGGGSNVSGASGCQTPVFFPAHQMAAAAQQVLGVPPTLFHLTSLCSNGYLTQAPPPHQANGAAGLPPFFPTAPPPYGLHAHSHADVSSHMLGTQAVAVAAATSYNLQQITTTSFCQRIYQHMYPNHVGMQPPVTIGAGGVNKKNGNVSCYNCGTSNHYAQDCSQPPIDSTQQGKGPLAFLTSKVREWGLILNKYS